jgi:hypothetical protein
VKNGQRLSIISQKRAMRIRFGKVPVQHHLVVHFAMTRVLAPGGELVMSADALTLAKRWPGLYARHCERYHVQRTYSAEQLKLLLAERGLAVDDYVYQFRSAWAQRMYLGLSAYGGKFGFNAAAPALPLVAAADRFRAGAQEQGAIVLVHARRADLN